MQKTGSNTRQSSLLILFGEEVWHFGKTVTFSGKRENFLWKGKKRVPKAAQKVAGTDFTSFQSAEENGWILASFLVCSLQLEPFLQQWLAAKWLCKKNHARQLIRLYQVGHDDQLNAENVTNLPHLMCPTPVTKIYSRTNQNNWVISYFQPGKLISTAL